MKVGEADKEEKPLDPTMPITTDRRKSSVRFAVKFLHFLGMEGKFLSLNARKKMVLQELCWEVKLSDANV